MSSAIRVTEVEDRATANGRRPVVDLVAAPRRSACDSLDNDVAHDRRLADVD
jgi:hypothetical protein